MLNYISAELYKLRHKKSLFIAVGLILLLESTLLLPGFQYDLDEAQTLIFLELLVVLLPMGLFLAPIFAAVTFDDQHGHGTLKNEVVFGIPRSRIYLGKLCAAMMAGTMAAAAVIGCYLLIAVLLARDIGAAGARVWQGLFLAGASMWLTWLAAVAFTFFLLFSLKSAGGAMAVVYLLTCFGLPLCMIGYEDPRHFDILYWFSRLFYAAPCRELVMLPGALEGEGDLALRVLGRSAVICLGWVGGTSALGLALFRRQEVK